jgi:hypothetical protein
MSTPEAMQTAWFYTFSAIPQTVAGVIGLIGAFAFFRMQGIEAEAARLFERIADFATFVSQPQGGKHPKVVKFRDDFRHAIDEGRRQDAALVEIASNENAIDLTLGLLKSWAEKKNVQEYDVERVQRTIAAYKLLAQLEQRIRLAIHRALIAAAVVVLVSLILLPLGPWLGSQIWLAPPVYVAMMGLVSHATFKISKLVTASLATPS